MNWLRQHWFDLGGVFAVCIAVFLWRYKDWLSLFQQLVWLNLLALFLHQLEEYRYPGTFPGMINRVMFKSLLPDRYPLNPQSALIINVVTGWGTYGAAAILAEKAAWLGIATMLVSAGNVLAHTLLFNGKGKTWYNAGMVTALLLFTPVAGYFFYLLLTGAGINPMEYAIGVILGILLTYLGILKMTDWMKDRNSAYRFPERSVK
jgi:hypothetical protein